MSEELIFGDRDNIVSLMKRCIHKAGIWKGVSRSVYWLNKIAHICLLSTLVTLSLALYMAIGDTDKLFECISVFTFCVMGFLKLNTLRSNQHRWTQLLIIADSLEDEQLKDEVPIGKYDSIDDVAVAENSFTTGIQAYTARFQSLSTTIINIYSFTVVIFIASPFIEYGYWKLNGVELEVRPHVLPGWAPLDRIGFWGYLPTVSAEFVAAVYIVLVHTAFDLMVFGLMIFISGQFSLLRDYSKDLGGSGKHFSLSVERDARAHHRIIRCHRTLISLESSLAELDNLVQNILGIYFFVVTLTLCAVAMRLSTDELTVMQVISLVQYTGGSLTQLFLFCYYGDMVLHKSSVGMGEGPYAAAYWCLSPRIRKEMLLLAAGMSRVRRLRAGPFNSLDLPSFIQIVRAAYSYYAVMRK